MKNVSFAVVCLFLSGFACAEIGGESTFTDPRDGKVYRTNELHFQPWMLSNMNYKIPGSFCYDNDERNCEKFGRLYTWDAAQKACPEGWHLPSAEEWKDLVESGKTVQDEHQYWRGYDVLEFPDNAGGFKNSKGKFELINVRADFWSSTEKNNGKAYYWFWTNSKHALGNSDYSKKGAMSVRCVSDCQGGQAGFCDGSMMVGEWWPMFENDHIKSCMNGSNAGAMGYVGVVHFVAKKDAGEIDCYNIPGGDNDQSIYLKNSDMVVTEKVADVRFAECLKHEGCDVFFKGKPGAVEVCYAQEEGDVEGTCLPYGAAENFLTPMVKNLLK